MEYQNDLKDMFPSVNKTELLTACFWYGAESNFVHM